MKTSKLSIGYLAGNLINQTEARQNEARLNFSGRGFFQTVGSTVWAIMFLADSVGYIAGSIIALILNVLKITFDTMIGYIMEIIVEILLSLLNIADKIGLKELAINFVDGLGQIQYHLLARPILYYSEYISNPATMVSLSLL